MDPLRFLSRADVAALLPLPDCVAAVRESFRVHAAGRLPGAPGLLGMHVEGGGLHVKTAAMDRGRRYAVAKVNANFPGNASIGLPTVQGVIVLLDGRLGTPLAVMDSIEITLLRTAAASAVAADALARPDAATLGICGCGVQGRVHWRAMAGVRAFRRVLVYDVVAERARSLAGEASAAGAEALVAGSVADVVSGSDVCVTCTPSRTPIVTRDMLREGLFLAAVGADHPEKCEIDPRALAAGTLVVDLLEQAAAIGDLHHALERGVMTRADVRGELGQVLLGQRPGRTSRAEVIIFDSTGTALQDVAAAAIAYERGVQQGRGVVLDLHGTPAPVA